MARLALSPTVGLLLVLLVAHLSAFEFWNDLRVTWGPTPEVDYNAAPRNVRDATKSGWLKTSDSADCTNGGAYNGFQWIHPSDTGIAVLFDINGNAGGIQTLVPQSELLVPGSTYEFDQMPMYQNQTINGVTYFVLTAYFVEPEILCQTRPAPNTGNIGSSSQVYFQSGYGIGELKVAYKYRADATANGWTKNNCIPGMGFHNFYSVETYEDYSCNRIQPTCILYNDNDEMLGFCLTYPGNATADSFEHPSPGGIQASLGNAPQCLLDQAVTLGATTVHVYFINDPWTQGCPQ